MRFRSIFYFYPGYIPINIPKKHDFTVKIHDFRIFIALKGYKNTTRTFFIKIFINLFYNYKNAKAFL